MAKPKALILTGYGINCEEETSFAIEKHGAISDVVHINDIIDGSKKLSDYQILLFPGGFSYGDDTGAGKAFANRILNNIQDDFLNFIQKDTLTLGICNGFQIMTAIGIVPALDGKYGERQVALMTNENARYVCRWVKIKNVSKKCIFTKGVDEMYVPIAHGEGNFYAKDTEIKKLQDNDQIVFKYIDENGDFANQKFPENPNGAILDIAAVCDPSGRIMGIMPHPERHLCFSNRPDFTAQKEALIREGKDIPKNGEGVKIFQNAVEYFM